LNDPNRVKAGTKLKIPTGKVPVRRENPASTNDDHNADKKTSEQQMSEDQKLIQGFTPLINSQYMTSIPYNIAMPKISPTTMKSLQKEKTAQAPRNMVSEGRSHSYWEPNNAGGSGLPTGMPPIADGSDQPSND